MNQYRTDITVVLPSLNPDEKFSGVVQGLVDAGFRDIVIVNDGSTGDHLERFVQAEALPGVVVLHHEVNKGKGRALKTAFEYVVNHRPDSQGVVTIDGDGQHLLQDIIACSDAMLEYGDQVIMGCRDFNAEGIPARSRGATNSLPPCFYWAAEFACRTPRPGCGPFPSGIWRSFVRSRANGLNTKPICSCK